LGISYTNRALKTFSNICGEQNIHVVNVRNLLNWMYLIRDDDVQALETGNESSNIHKNITIDENRYKASRYTNLEYVHWLKKDYLNAKAAYKQTLETSLSLYENYIYDTWTS